MTNQAAEQEASWQPRQVYAMATVCLAVGLLVGYLLRGSAKPGASTLGAAPESQAAMNGAPVNEMPTLEQMKHMADKQAEPLLAKLAAEPNNTWLLLQIGNIYKSTHQFQQAAEYYGKAVELAPKNVAIRTEMASCLYYSGDVDGALAQLEQSLKYDPKDANSLFNLGMIKWKSKNDAAGAIAAWRQLLRTHPDLDKKPIVEQMIAEAQQHESSQSSLGRLGKEQ